MASVTMDVHEPKAIAAHLESLEVPFAVRKITPGDYVVGDVGVERKTLGDFFNSLVQKRLFDQLVRLKSCYEMPILLVEGDLNDISNHRNPSAIWGALMSIVLDQYMKVIFSPNRLETARVLRAIWRRQENGESENGLRHKPKMLTIEEKQLFMIQGFPSIGSALSRNMLQQFGSVRSVMLANKEDLMRVPKLGPKKADSIIQVLDERFRGSPKKVDAGASDTRE